MVAGSRREAEERGHDRGEGDWVLASNTLGRRAERTREEVSTTVENF
jgi:hypothetical protein